MVELSWRAVTGRVRHTMALLEDISRSGACLQLESPLPLGLALRLKCRRQEYTGTVRYCVYREIGYFVGVEFGPASHWSVTAFRPQHLLDLRKLTGGGYRAN
jgi:hypothetical protein